MKTKDETIRPTILPMERDAILAGLRMLQWYLENGLLMEANPNGRMGSIRDIYQNCGEHEGLSESDIDLLCDRLNR